MDSITVSATELKNNTAHLLNRVKYEGIEVLVERHGEVVAKLTPTKRDVSEKELQAQRLAAWEKLYGAYPDMLSAEEVRKSRYFSGKRLTGEI